jgi:hypothetical protein
LPNHQISRDPDKALKVASSALRIITVKVEAVGICGAPYIMEFMRVLVEAYGSIKMPCRVSAKPRGVAEHVVGSVQRQIEMVLRIDRHLLEAVGHPGKEPIRVQLHPFNVLEWRDALRCSAVFELQ